MRIEKHCVVNPHAHLCVQCRREIKKKGQRCDVYVEMSKRWPEVIAHLQAERERIQKENARLRQELDTLTLERSSREAAVVAVRKEFQKFSSTVSSTVVH